MWADNNQYHQNPQPNCLTAIGRGNFGCWFLVVLVVANWFGFFGLAALVAAALVLVVKGVYVKQHQGATLDARTGKWVARIYSRGVRRHLGYFDTAEAAADAYALAKGEAAAVRTIERVKAAPKPKAKAVIDPYNGKGSFVAPDVVADLVSDLYISYEMGLGSDFGDIARVSRIENVSTWTVSSIAWLDYGQNQEALTTRVRLLKGLGLADRVDEVIDRATRQGDLLSFEVAAHEVACGDLV